jgi:predicted Holliday junction resolvase-like endonuclease
VANKAIAQLRSIRGLRIECPSCGEESSVSRFTLFGMHDEYPPSAKKLIDARLQNASLLADELRERSSQLALDVHRRPARITAGAHYGGFGNICEQILPAFLTFPYEHHECRALFKPVDYVVFAGLSGRTGIERVKFVDVKTSKGRLSPRQKQIMKCIGNGKLLHRIIGR